MSSCRLEDEQAKKTKICELAHRPDNVLLDVLVLELLHEQMMIESTPFQRVYVNTNKKMSRPGRSRWGYYH
jgi:hypothetical protein